MDTTNSPLEQQRLSKEAEERLSQLIMLDEKLKNVDKGILEVELHIIDRLRNESGASNISLLAEALETVRKMERREGDE